MQGAERSMALSLVALRCIVVLCLCGTVPVCVCVCFVLFLRLGTARDPLPPHSPCDEAR